MKQLKLKADKEKEEIIIILSIHQFVGDFLMVTSTCNNRRIQTTFFLSNPCYYCGIRCCNKYTLANDK